MTDTDDDVSGLQLSNNTYNNAKFVVHIVLPALAVLYSTLSEFWGFPRVQEVVGSISAVALFLGVILRISSASYSQTKTEVPEGSFVIKTDVDNKKTILLELDNDPEDFIGKDSITFRVKKASE